MPEQIQHIEKSSETTSNQIEWPFVARLLLISFAYFGTGKLGLTVPYVGSHITLIWLPAGISVAALIRWGDRYWPAVFLGALTVNLSVGSTWLLASCIAVGNTLAPLVVTWMLRRRGFRPMFDRPDDVTLFCIAAGLGMLVSASGGVLSLYLAGLVTWNALWSAWLPWWLGDTVGVLLAAPLLLTVTRTAVSDLWRQRRDFAFWCLTIGVVSWVIFIFNGEQKGHVLPLAFLPLPLVVWAALRFEVVGAMLTVLIFSATAAWSAATGHSTFSHLDTRQELLGTWAFMAASTSVVLMLTFLQNQRNKTVAILRQSEANLSHAQRVAHLGSFEWNILTGEVQWSDEHFRLWGLEPQSIRPSYELFLRSVHPEDVAHVEEIISRALHGEKTYECFHRVRRVDGTERHIHGVGEVVYDREQPVRMVGTVLDVTERKAAEKEIHKLAFYDPVTGLPNRRLMTDWLRYSFASSAQHNDHGAVLFIDLDNFKRLNDTKGHEIGDLLLIEVAKRLQGCVRSDDAVARLGGDEFVVMLEGLSGHAEQAAAQAQLVGEKILAAINMPYALHGQEYHSSASIGIVIFHGQEITADELLKRADAAMYQSKTAGRNTLRFFDQDLQVKLELRMALEADLRHAIQRKQLKPYYQMQVDDKQGIVGAELLLRWEHPERGFVLPAQFIPLAEETGLIVPIGFWVIEAACLQIKTWEGDPRMSELELAVNVSARQFRQPDFVEQVHAVLDHTGANPNRLKLELTESLILDSVDDTVAKMLALKEMGIHFSLDDFGTGQSSLTYLKKLPLDQLKIDRSFVRDIVTDPNDAAIVQTIIGMANNLGLQVIAEGVETEAQLALLKQHGCSVFQGFLFGKPVPLREFEKVLEMQ